MIEGCCCKVLLIMLNNVYTHKSNKSWFISVPAFAVIQKGQTLFVFIRYKGYVGDNIIINFKKVNIIFLII